MELILIGVMSGVGMILILMKADIKKAAGYALYIDISFTGLLAWLFAGTFSGMVAAMSGGIVVSVFLALVQTFVGAKRLTRRGWITYEPKILF